MKHRSDNMSSNNSGEATDLESRSGPNTEPHSLRTLSYLANAKLIGYKGPQVAQTCKCGCTINGIHTYKPHFRVRDESKMNLGQFELANQSNWK